MDTRTGAGVIPFAVEQGLTRFLFHKTFSGRRAGLLVDFGGGSRPGESHAQTAAREFIEETESMYLSDDTDVISGHAFQSQYRLMLRLIEHTQRQHPYWYCSRNSKNETRPRNWKTFFVEVEYRDPTRMNQAWAQDTSGRYKKRRELVWLTAEQLIAIIDSSPQSLWKRIRQYQGLREVVLAIAEH